MDRPVRKRHRRDATCLTRDQECDKSHECLSAGTGDTGDRTTLTVERCGVQPPQRQQRVNAELKTEQMVENMQAEVMAMKAAQDGLPRPDGCSVKAFKNFTRLSRNADAFQARIDTNQARIDAAQKRIDRFASVTAAYDAVKALDHMSLLKGFSLSDQKWCNADAIKNALFEGMRKLIEKSYGVANDKSVVPLMCVVGAPGQGKTDTLKHIRDDDPLRNEIVETVRAHAKRVQCKACVALMATFNQHTTYNCDDEANVVAALCNRLLADYVGVHFDESLTNRFNGISLPKVLDLVRQEEATKRECEASEVCVMVLVDELRKLGSKMSVLLDALCAVQQHELMKGFLTFVVATCLDVESIFSVVTQKSKRPLHLIPLAPCSAPDMNDFVVRCLEATRNLLDGNGQRSEDLQWSAHATGGHFRSLEELWSYFVVNSSVPPHESCASVTSAYILEIVARQLHSPDKLLIRESEMIGAVFGNSKDSKSLYEIAMSNTEGVFYKDVNLATCTVTPCVSPISLRGRLAYMGDSQVAQNIVSLWPCLHSLITGKTLVKSWEVAVPLLEAVAATLIREVGSKGTAVRLEHVYRGAFVKQWPSTAVVLEYAASCSDCMNIWKPDPKAKGVVTKDSKDSQVLAETCKSTKATLCVAVATNHSAIEGVHTLLEASGSPVPVFFQMKTQSEVTAVLLNQYAKAAHVHAQSTLKLQKGSYFVALYVKVWLRNVRGWELLIPSGTIVIDGSTLERVLEPFGATPLLHFLQGART
jgi:hypothetical protein